MKLKSVATILLNAVIFGSSAFARPLSPPFIETSAALVSSAELDSRDVATFFDGMIPTMLETGDVAGATVSIVKDGRIIFAKGYGLADVAKKKPVVADKTLFRPGSVSKLFTWTAVMQLVEQGKVDLDRDVNDYLDFKLPNTFGKPITMRHIMTHTAGFEERNLDLIQFDNYRNQVTLGDEVKRRIPKQIFAPGSVPAYSNYATAVAGYVVERVSHEKFEDYVERHIFKPLNMKRATFRQPIPAALESDLSKGYERASRKDTGFEVINMPNAGALTVTSTDMANFMLAYLGGGVLPSQPENSRILRAATIQQMWAPANIAAPGVDPMGLGFYGSHRNGYAMRVHGGNTANFHSYLWLVPEVNSGIFLSWNSQGKDAVAPNIYNYVVINAFMDRYFPARSVEKPKTLSTHAAHSARLVGEYLTSRRTGHGILAFFEGLQPQILSIDEKGWLISDSMTDIAGTPVKLHEVAPWQWQELGGQRRLGAVQAPDGSIKSIASMAIANGQPVSTWRSISWLMPANISALVILVIWMVANLWHLLQSYVLHTTRMSSVLYLQGRRWSRVGGALSIIFAASLVGFVIAGSINPYWVIASERLPLLRMIQIFAILCVLGAGMSLFGVVKTWRAPSRRWYNIIGATLISLSCCILAYCIIIFDIWSFDLNF